MHGQHQHTETCMARTDSLTRSRPSPWPSERSTTAKSGRAVASASTASCWSGRLGADNEVGFGVDQRPQSAPHQRVIVDDEDPPLDRRWLCSPLSRHSLRRLGRLSWRQSLRSASESARSHWEGEDVLCRVNPQSCAIGRNTYRTKRGISRCGRFRPIGSRGGRVPRRTRCPACS